MNKEVLVVLLTLLLVSILTFNIKSVKSGGTIYIRVDGSVEPDTAPISSVDNVIYAITDNIYDTIVVERDNIAVNGAGFTLQGTGSGRGIDLSERNNVTIKNLEIEAFSYGIWLSHSSSNKICGNNITNNGGGIPIIHSSNHNNVSGNKITNVEWSALEIGASSSYNSVYKNTITNNGDGIQVYWSSDYNTISENYITNNGGGITLYGNANHNNVSGNNIMNNYGIGIWLRGCSDNVIYHNNFVSNTNNVHIPYSGYANFWDDGYPSGGNYWSDHVTVDFSSGINQDELGSDGIVDEPYIIDDFNRDNYPLVNPWTPTPPAITATIDTDPDTLNLKSKGKWITAYIELPEGYDVNGIDVSKVRLDDTIPAELCPTEIGDYDNEGIPDLMVKFSRQDLIEILCVGQATLTITGEVAGTLFEGSGNIIVR